MGLFGKKQQDDSAQAPQEPQPAVPQTSGVPFDQVNVMRQQGIPDPQIVQTLQRDGYQSHQIFDAMNQADLQPGAPPPLDAEPDPLSVYPDMTQDMTTEAQSFDEPQPEYEDFQTGAAVEGLSSSEMDSIEEVAEAIIDEKWSELMAHIKKIVDWKERMEQKINEMEQTIEELKNKVKEIEVDVNEKMGEYDKNISSVGTDVKAMEKVFHKMLPTFTENISELSQITKDLKK